MFLSLETLAPIIRTGLLILVELIGLVSSVVIFLSQMTLVGWLTFLLGSQALILTFLLFWISFLSSNASICSTLAFPPLGNSDHVDFPSNSQRDAPFHCIAYGYSRADWDVLCDSLRDVPWKDIFKRSASAVYTELFELIQFETDVYIPHRKYWVKSHSSPWFQLLALLP